MISVCARFPGLMLLSGLLAACGGSATRAGHDTSEGGTGAGASSAAGSNAGGGTASSAAGSNAGGPGHGEGASGSAPQWFADVKLDETFPWFVQSSGGEYQTAPDDGDTSLVHVRLEGTPVQATISTHNHVSVVELATAVEFAAWASEPLTILVSARSRLDDADYFAARAIGHHWPVASVELATTRQHFRVRLEDMAPAEAPGTDIPPSFMIGFVVEKPVGPVELWLDDVNFL